MARSTHVIQSDTEVLAASRVSGQRQSQPPQQAPLPPSGRPRDGLARLRAKARAHLDDPLFRNAYALMMNTAATGLLGLLYWLLVARLYHPADVGRASAAYSAMNLLAGVTGLSFTGALTRFLPQAGHHTRGLIARAYVVCAAGSVVLAIGFLLVVDKLGPSYAELATVGTGTVFLICVAAWVLFTLQDSVLTGLRSATWVLAENTAFGLVKIGLLVALVAALPHLGIYVSWMLPVFVAVPLINAVIFRNVVPRHARLTAGSPPPTGRQIGRFLAGDYTGALAVLATNSLVPVLVATQIGAAPTAYFYMAWTVGSVLGLLGVNMAMSLTVEGSFDARSIAVNCRAALRRMAMILVPCALATALFARWGLGLFGPGYAANGAAVLQLLALAAIPQAAVELYLGVLRARSRTTLVAAVQGLRCALVLGGTLALTAGLGTVGASAAFLASQVVMAVLISPGLLLALTGREGRLVRRARAGSPAGAAALPPGGRVPEPVTMPVPAVASQPAQVSAWPDSVTLPMPIPARPPGGPHARPEALTLPMPVPVPARPHGSAAASPEPAARRRRPGAGRLAARWPAWLPAAAMAAAAASGLAMFFAFLPGTDLHRMNGLGLVSALPLGSLAGVAVLALAFMAGLSLRKAYPAVLGTALVALVACLDGVTAVVEHQPRFPTAYQIAGFVDYIAKNGHAAPGLGAYFSWPGFFAFMAYLSGVAGQHSLLLVLKFWPVAIDALCLLPLFLIMRALRISWRARWLAGFFFTVGNWVGQDYFSPQAFNYLLYLVFVAILVNWFTGSGQQARPREAAQPRWLARLRRLARPRWLGRLNRRVFGVLGPGEHPARPASAGQRAFLLALLTGIYLVSVSSHQLSPFYMLGACTVLVLIRRCPLRGLPVLFGVIVLGWVSFAAVAYWSGHMSDIFGGFGHVGSNISSSVGGRMTGSSSVHQLALKARVLAAGLMLGMAVAGLLRRRLRHMDDRILIALLCMPLLSIALQNYGGEIALRIYLFLLPAAAILAACLFFPGPGRGRRSWRWLPVLAACAVVLPVVFFLARYGNENYERTPTGELTAVNWVYAHEGKGAQLLWLSESQLDVTPQMPWSYQDLAKLSFAPALAPLNPASTGGLVTALRRDGPRSYLIVTRTQLAYLNEAAGYPPGWGPRFRAAMARAPRVRVAFANASASVYTVRFPPGTRARPPVQNVSGPAVPATVWTPLGLAALCLLIIVLLAREFIRVAAPAATRLLRPLGLAAVPLLLITVAIIGYRFMVL